MATLKNLFGKLALPMLGVTFLVLGLLSAKDGSLGGILLGLLEGFTGLCCLCAS